MGLARSCVGSRVGRESDGVAGGLGEGVAMAWESHGGFRGGTVGLGGGEGRGVCGGWSQWFKGGFGFRGLRCRLGLI